MTSICRRYSQTISYPTKLRYLNEWKILVGLLALFVSYISSNFKYSTDEDDTKEIVEKNIRYSFTMLIVHNNVFRCKL